MVSKRSFLMSLLLLSTTGSLSAQQPFYMPPTKFGWQERQKTAADEGKITFRTQSILVQVPVIVTDKSGNHIHGLTKDEFRLTENGKQQNLSSFEEVTATNSRLPVTPMKPGQFANLTLSDDQPRIVTVIAIDTINTPLFDHAYGRQQVLKYLADNVDPGQVLALMIMSSGGVKVVQGLTEDPQQLISRLKKLSGGSPAMQGLDADAQASAAMGRIPALPPATVGMDGFAYMRAIVALGDATIAQFKQMDALEATINAFNAIAWSLSGVPGRKSLIWLTGGFPFLISSPDAIPDYLGGAYERAMHALDEAQISVYPVDVTGLTMLGAADASRASLKDGAQASGLLSKRSWLHQSATVSLNQVAEMTGGKAFYNTNDLANSFKRAAEDSSSYYMLGYYLDAKNNNAGWRQLKVHVDKKDVEVRARKGFFVTNATLHAELSKNSDLSYALSTPIEGTGVPITVEWAGVAGDGEKKRADYVAHMPPNSLAFDPAGQNRLNFDFVAVAYKDREAKPAATSVMNYAKTVPEAQLASLKTNGIDFRNALELAPGNYLVRFVVRDNVTGKIGSLTAPLTVN